MIDSLGPQDRLYTLIEREGADETVRVIGSLAGLIFAGSRRPSSSPRSMSRRCGS